MPSNMHIDEDELRAVICRHKDNFEYSEIARYLTDILAKTSFHKDVCSRLYNELGLALLHLDKGADAEKAFQCAIESNPQNAKAHFNFGNMALYAQNFTEGRRRFQHVIDLEPHHIGALHHLGLCFVMDNKPSDALIFFEKAVRLENDGVGQNFWAGESLVQVKRYAEALPYFYRALQSMPNHQESLRGIAVCQYHTEAYEACIATCNDLIRQGSGFEFIAFRMKGDAFLKLKNVEEAAKAHTSMLQLDFDARHYTKLCSQKLYNEKSPMAKTYTDIITNQIPLLDAAFLHGNNATEFL